MARTTKADKAREADKAGRSGSKSGSTTGSKARVGKAKGGASDARASDAPARRKASGPTRPGADDRDGVLPPA